MLFPEGAFGAPGLVEELAAPELGGPSANDMSALGAPGFSKILPLAGRPLLPPAPYLGNGSLGLGGGASPSSAIRDKYSSSILAFSLGFIVGGPPAPGRFNLQHKLTTLSPQLTITTPIN